LERGGRHVGESIAEIAGEPDEDPLLLPVEPVLQCCRGDMAMVYRAAIT
jgi:hypothetical protein